MTRPVREKRPLNKASTSRYFRKCARCGNGFMECELGANDRGVFVMWTWYCSRECADR